MGGAAGAGVHPIHSIGRGSGKHTWYHWMRSVVRHVAAPAAPTPQFCAALGWAEALTIVFEETSRQGTGADDGWTLAEFERCCKAAGSRLLDCDPEDEAYASQTQDDEGGAQI